MTGHKSPDSEDCPGVAEWVTASALSRGDVYRGAKTLKDGFNALRSALIPAFQGLGLSQADAAAFVERHFIGLRQPPKGKPALAASPLALELLEMRGQLGSRRSAIPLAGEGWMSGSRLHRAGYARGGWLLDQEIETLRDALVGDVAQSLGIGPEEASTLVDAQLVGMRRPPRGPSALYASADAVRLLEEEGLLKPANHRDRVRRPPAGESPGGEAITR